MTKIRVRLRLPECELTRLDQFVRASGCLSRSALVNLVVERFLDSPGEVPLTAPMERRVKVLLDAEIFERLCGEAKRIGIAPTQLMQLGLRNFIRDQSDGQTRDDALRLGRFPPELCRAIPSVMSGNPMPPRAKPASQRPEEVMDWNPDRAGKIEHVSPAEMKRIWKT